MKSVFVVVAALAAASPGIAAQPIYTDTADCRAEDGNVDEFIKFCQGPDRYAAVLYYFDGRAAVFFGPSGAKKDEIRDGYVDDAFEAITVGVGPKVFGDKIEWVKNAKGTPCALIVRVYTPEGSTLVVAGLKMSSRAKSNEQARKAASTVCSKTSPPDVAAVTMAPVETGPKGDALRSEIASLKTELTEYCLKMGGEKIEFGDQFEQTTDLNGDGRHDALLWAEYVSCEGAYSIFGGSAGTQARILLSKGDGSYDQQDEFYRAIEILPNGQLSISRHGSACKKAGAADCTEIVEFRGTRMKHVKWTAGR